MHTKLSSAVIATSFDNSNFAFDFYLKAIDLRVVLQHLNERLSWPQL